MRKFDARRLWHDHQPTIYGAAIGLSCATLAFLMILRLQPHVGEACDEPGHAVVRHFDSEAENGGRLVCAITDGGLRYTTADSSTLK